MDLKEKIRIDMRESLRARDTLRLSVLRMLNAAILNKEIGLQKKDVGLSDPEVLGVLRAESKKRKDSITEFQKGGRVDLVEKESKELEILSGYLPPELPDDEVLRIVTAAVRETGATGPADFGKVMKQAMIILKGRASGDRVSKVLSDKLGQ